MVLMDTPYRLTRLLEELTVVIPDRKAILGVDLTQTTEKIVTGKVSTLSSQFKSEKAEFVLLVI